MKTESFTVTVEKEIAKNTELTVSEDAIIFSFSISGNEENSTATIETESKFMLLFQHDEYWQRYLS